MTYCRPLCCCLLFCSVWWNFTQFIELNVFFEYVVFEEFLWILIQLQMVIISRGWLWSWIIASDYAILKFPALIGFSNIFKQDLNLATLRQISSLLWPITIFISMRCYHLRHNSNRTLFSKSFAPFTTCLSNRTQMLHLPFHFLIIKYTSNRRSIFNRISFILNLSHMCFILFLF